MSLANLAKLLVVICCVAPSPMLLLSKPYSIFFIALRDKPETRIFLHAPSFCLDDNKQPRRKLIFNN